MSSILDQYFTDEDIMSVHIQQGQTILTKQGKPGGRSMHYGKKVMSKQDLQEIIDTLYQEIETREDGFIEIQRSSSSVLQLGTYRIVIVRPPVANTTEITVVRPIAKLTLTDYDLSEDTASYLTHQAR